MTDHSEIQELIRMVTVRYLIRKRAVLNTWFNDKSIHMYTWQRNEYKFKSMVDLRDYDEKCI